MATTACGNVAGNFSIVTQASLFTFSCTVCLICAACQTRYNGLGQEEGAGSKESGENSEFLTVVSTELVTDFKSGLFCGPTFLGKGKNKKTRRKINMKPIFFIGRDLRIRINSIFIILTEMNING